MTGEEIRAAVRSQGIASLDEVAAVVLETDGSFSVLRRTEDGGTSALANVAGHARPSRSVLATRCRSRGWHVAWGDAQDGPADKARQQRSAEEAATGSP